MLGDISLGALRALPTLENRGRAIGLTRVAAKNGIVDLRLEHDGAYLAEIKGVGLAQLGEQVEPVDVGRLEVFSQGPRAAREENEWTVERFLTARRARQAQPT